MYCGKSLNVDFHYNTFVSLNTPITQANIKYGHSACMVWMDLILRCCVFYVCMNSYLEAFIVIHVLDVMVQNMYKNPRLIREHHVALVCRLIQINHANTDFLVSPMHGKEPVTQGQSITTTIEYFSSSYYSHDFV